MAKLIPKTKVSTWQIYLNRIRYLGRMYKRIRDLGRVYKRIEDLGRMYKLLDELATCTHSRQKLSTCLKDNVQSEPGVYFFYDNNEQRSDSGDGARIVRVGQSLTLCSRILQHKGNKSGGGDHNISVFRLLVGTALLAKNKQRCDDWDIKGPRPKGTLIDKSIDKSQVEQCVTKALENMRVLCLPIEDEAERNFIEHNTTALLSNYCRCPTDCQCSTDCQCLTNCGCPIDPPSNGWLGYHCTRKKVRRSGLWSQKDVEDIHNPRFLDTLEGLILNL